MLNKPAWLGSRRIGKWRGSRVKMKLTFVAESWLEVLRKTTGIAFILSTYLFQKIQRHFHCTSLITQVTVNYNFAAQKRFKPVGSSSTSGYRKTFYLLWYRPLPFKYRLCCCFAVALVFGFFSSQSQYCRFISLAMSVFLRLLYCFLLQSTANSLSLVGFPMTLFERNVQLYSVFI